MTDRILAAIARRADRLARGIDLRKDDARERKKLRASHWMHETPLAKRGRNKARNARFTRMDQP